MKRERLRLVMLGAFAGILGGATFALAEEEEVPPETAGAAEVWAEIAEIKQNKLMEVLELQADETQAFVDMYTRWEDVRWGYRERRGELITELREAVTAVDDARKVDVILNDIDALDAESRSTEGRLRNEFRTVLSEDQYAKLMLFEDTFTRQLRKMVQEQNQAPPCDVTDE